MILLRPDCLVFKTTDGEHIPCSVHEVTVELLGGSAEWLEPEIIEHAAEAVLFYFKWEKGMGSVSVSEFSAALERVLKGLGLNVASNQPEPAPTADEPGMAPATEVAQADLRELAVASGDGRELVFFPNLRRAVRQLLDDRPMLVRFSGLRDCVRELTGARRWSRDCQKLNDQIVDYVRGCLRAEAGGRTGCAAVVW